MNSSYNSLSNCINSFRASIDLLNDSIETLTEATKEVPRLKKVLATKKVFGLVPESDLENAKRNVQQEIKPQIKIMIRRIESEISKMKRRKANLSGKVDLQDVRIKNANKGKEPISEIRGISTKRIRKGDIDESKLEKLSLLQYTKGRLQYSLSRLDLQDKRARLSIAPSLSPLTNIEK